MIPIWGKLAVLAFGAIALVLVVVAPQRPAWDSRVFSELRNLDAQLVDRELPALELRTLDGEPFSLASLRGRVVFLNLWASWCKPCRDELPSMIELASELETEGERFEMVAVSWDDDAESVEAFLGSDPRLGALRERATLLLDPEGAVTGALGTRLLPETWVIDREGRIVARIQSVRDWTSPESLALFQALIRQR